jgi:hypothetical protein
MSCSSEDHRVLSALYQPSQCGDLPTDETTQPVRKKIYAIVDSVNNEMFIGLNEEQCKMVIIGAVRENTVMAKLHALTPDDIILVSPEHIKEEVMFRHQDIHAKVIKLLRDNGKERAANIVEASKIIAEEVSKMYSAKPMEAITPDKNEIRYRDEQYKNRQRHHNRG